MVTKIGMLRAFFIFFLAVSKKEQSKKRPKLFEAQAVAQGREGWLSQGQRGSHAHAGFYLSLIPSEQPVRLI